MEDFEIENGVLTEYQGEDVDVIVPEGVREIGEGRSGAVTLNRSGFRRESGPSDPRRL